jgi:hypothetical protein
MCPRQGWEYRRRRLRNLRVAANEFFFLFLGIVIECDSAEVMRVWCTHDLIQPVQQVCVVRASYYSGSRGKGVGVECGL